MGRGLSPILRQELANLDKDAESRRSAMKALKSYVKDLDSKAIPHFLAQVSQTKETWLSGECTISLYEILARVHGVKIVPLINNIMVTIVQPLSSSAGSFPLQQACSKVVPAIAGYGIDPTIPEDKKRWIIYSLCNPLAESLLGSRESLTSGAALCLKALVDCDNWRFASDEMVNKVCQIVAGGLEEKSTQTNAHMGLVMALAKRNATVVEPYARLLIQAGLQILNAGIVEGNSQKRLSAIQMVNFLMRWLDPWSFYSELQLIIEEMEKCQRDLMAYVRGAAFEALQTAKRISAEKCSKFEKSPVSVTGSNFSRRDHNRRCVSSPCDRSPSSVSPESQTLDSFVGYESWAESPISTRWDLQTSEYDRRSVNRKLWSFENGGVDVSLKDGILSQIAQESDISNTFSEHLDGKRYRDHEEYAGCMPRNPRNRMSKSTTSSPLRSRPSISVDNIIIQTPRKLVHSLQDANNVNSDCSEKQARQFRSLSLTDFDWSPVSRFDENYSSQDVQHPNCEANESLYADDEKLQGSPESVSSTDNISANVDEHVPDKVIEDHKAEKETQIQKSGFRKTHSKNDFKLVFAPLFLLVAAFILLVLMSEYNEFDGHHLVPT